MFNILRKFSKIPILRSMCKFCSVLCLSTVRHREFPLGTGVFNQQRNVPPTANANRFPVLGWVSSSVPTKQVHQSAVLGTHHRTISPRSFCVRPGQSCFELDGDGNDA